MLEKMRKTAGRDLMSRDVKFINEEISLPDAVWKTKEFGISSLIVESTDKAD